MFSNKGFTLVELLVVIVILAIVGMMGSLNFNNAINRSKDSQRRGDVEAIAKAFEANFAPFSGYQQLNSSQFANSAIPTPPEGGSYFIDSGNRGYKVCSAINGGTNPCSSSSQTCFCVQSQQESYLASGSPSPSSLPSSQPSPSASGSSSQIENLGNPTRARWPDSNSACRYARNVWDLQAFNGKIYIGSGNSSNLAPCGNAGPVDIIAYNPGSNTFAFESNISQEQIDLYKIINGVLTTGGHDPRGGTSNGMYWYTLDSGSWTTRTGPAEIAHVFDMASFGGKLFMAGNTIDLAVSQVLISSDNGQTWASSNLLDPFRSFTLFTLQNKLYVGRNWQQMFPTTIALYQYNTGTALTPFSNYTYNNFSLMFPQTSSAGITDAKIIRPINYNSLLVYIGAIAVNDQQADPFGLYKVSTITTGSTDASKMTLPGSAKPWDLLIGSDSKLYALGSIANGARFWITVSSTSDLTNWTEEFRFDSPTFARSFEQLNGYWYFGLGTDTTILSTSTGDILRKAI